MMHLRGCARLSWVWCAPGTVNTTELDCRATVSSSDICATGNLILTHSSADETLSSCVLSAVPKCRNQEGSASVELCFAGRSPPAKPRQPEPPPSPLRFLARPNNPKYISCSQLPLCTLVCQAELEALE